MSQLELAHSLFSESFESGHPRWAYWGRGERGTVVRLEADSPQFYEKDWKNGDICTTGEVDESPHLFPAEVERIMSTLKRVMTKNRTTLSAEHYEACSMVSHESRRMYGKASWELVKIVGTDEFKKLLAKERKEERRAATRRKRLSRARAKEEDDADDDDDVEEEELEYDGEVQELWDNHFAQYDDAEKVSDFERDHYSDNYLISDSDGGSDCDSDSDFFD